MKKNILSALIISTLLGTSSAFAYSTKDLPDITQGQSIKLEDHEPILIKQKEVNANLKLLIADKQKYMFEVASFTDLKSRDIALDKLRITVYLISEWESHLN